MGCLLRVCSCGNYTVYIRVPLISSLYYYNLPQISGPLFDDRTKTKRSLLPMDFTSDVEHTSDHSDSKNDGSIGEAVSHDPPVGNFDAVTNLSRGFPVSSPLFEKPRLSSDRKVSSLNRLGISSSSSDSGGSDSEDSLLLGKEERERLELEEEKGKLLRERNLLLRHVDNLKKELRGENTIGAGITGQLKPGWKPGSKPDVDTSFSMHLEGNEEEKEEEPAIVDDNAADTLVDLLTIFPNSGKKKNTHIFNEDNSESQSLPTDLSELHTELSSRGESLPLLNMQLRLRYLGKYLYPNMKIHVHELKGGDTRGGTSTYITSVTFNRLKNKLSFKFRTTFEVPAADNGNATTTNNNNNNNNTHNQNNQGHGNLVDFSILDVSPKRFTRTVNRFIRRYPHNPTTLLFCLAEYERLIYLRDEIIWKLYSKYKNWIDGANLGHYTDICRRIRFQKHDIISNRMLLISFQVSLVDGSDDNNANNNSGSGESPVAVRVAVPSTEIYMTFLQDGQKVTDPDIDAIFSKLFKEYGLQQALVKIIETVLFPTELRGQLAQEKMVVS